MSRLLLEKSAWELRWPKPALSAASALATPALLNLDDVPSPESFDQVFPISDLHSFLRECDVVVNAAPLTPETRGMLGEAEFRQMKKTAHYICFSRGGIADYDALLRALDEGWISGAGLDAHSEEPLSPDSPSWTAPSRIVTPHNGASTLCTYERSWAIFRNNLARYAQGMLLVNVVDKRGGY